MVDTTKTMYQIDLPKVILNGANIKHNLTFLTDYIHGNKNDFIKKNIIPITEINKNGIIKFKQNTITENPTIKKLRKNTKKTL